MWIFEPNQNWYFWVNAWQPVGNCIALWGYRDDPYDSIKTLQITYPTQQTEGKQP